MQMTFDAVLPWPSTRWVMVSIRLHGLLGSTGRRMRKVSYNRVVVQVRNRESMLTRRLVDDSEKNCSIGTPYWCRRRNRNRPWINQPVCLLLNLLGPVPALAVHLLTTFFDRMRMPNRE